MKTIAMTVLVLAVCAHSAHAQMQNDDAVKTAVESTIERDGHLNLDDLQVSCADGLVTLRGTVLTGDERGLAELLAMQASGVRGVRNDIAVVLKLDRDLKLEKLAERTLLDNPLLHIAELELQSRHGVMTLHGIVLDPNERWLAQRLLSELPGVHGVVDDIEVLNRSAVSSAA